MKDITKEEKQLAIRMSRVIQAFFNANPGTTTLRSEDIYDILVTKGLVERDRHRGIKFREFLWKLKRANALAFIPQCRPQPGNGHYTNWIFQSVPSVAPLAVSAISKAPINEDDYAAIKAQIDSFDKRPANDFDHVAVQTRKTYSRAYEYWSLAEENLLCDTAKLTKSTLELSKIFGRQPSAIERKLKELGAV